MVFVGIAGRRFIVLHSRILKDAENVMKKLNKEKAIPIGKVVNEERDFMVLMKVYIWNGEMKFLQEIIILVKFVNLVIT